MNTISCGSLNFKRKITLSIAESEYVALSQALRPMIPVINLLEDFHKIFPEVSL